MPVHLATVMPRYRKLAPTLNVIERRRASWECMREGDFTAGTIMHRSHLPLKAWFMAVHTGSQSDFVSYKSEILFTVGQAKYRRKRNSIAG